MFACLQIGISIKNLEAIATSVDPDLLCLHEYMFWSTRLKRLSLYA